jgi:hypothetical protein
VPAIPAADFLVLVKLRDAIYRTKGNVQRGIHMENCLEHTKVTAVYFIDGDGRGLQGKYKGDL